LFHSVSRKTSQRGVGGADSVASVAGVILVGSQFFHPLKARSALFHSPPVDTRPFAVLIDVLWFRRCLLRLGCSAVTGAWLPRARVFFVLWAARDGHVPYLCRAGWCPGVFLALGGCKGCPVAARVLQAPSPVVFTQTADPALGVFFALDRLYLTACFGFDLVWSLLLSTIL